MAEDRALPDLFKALSNPVRMELLRSLRHPRTLGDIRLRPRRAGSAPGPMSRVTVKRHLEMLLAIGAVRLVRLVRDGRLMDHYIVDHGRLFALAADLGQLARIHPDEPFLDGTQPGPAASPMRAPGPKLVLLNGVQEGRVFPLDALAAGRWLVGRRADAAIRLEYDPFVSLAHAEIAARGSKFYVRDLPGSRNGTTWNGEPLPKGEDRPLAAGDLVGVGRCLLLFRPS